MTLNCILKACALFLSCVILKKLDKDALTLLRNIEKNSKKYIKVEADSLFLQEGSAVAQ